MSTLPGPTSTPVTPGSLLDHLQALEDAEYRKIVEASRVLRGLPQEEQARATRRIAEAAEALDATPARDIPRGASTPHWLNCVQATRRLPNTLHGDSDEREREGEAAFEEAAEAARHRAAFVYANNKARALEALLDAVRLNSSNAMAWIDLGDVARAAGTLEQAARAYKRYRELADRSQNQRREWSPTIG